MSSDHDNNPLGNSLLVRFSGHYWSDISYTSVLLGSLHVKSTKRIGDLTDLGETFTKCILSEFQHYSYFSQTKTLFG